MLPVVQGDQDGYLRELDASDILAIHGESSGQVYLYRVCVCVCRNK